VSSAFCAAQSLEVGEALAGTAIAKTDRFLVLEHAGPWGPKGVEDSDFSVPVAGHLQALTKRHPRLRVQLVRTSGSTPQATRRLYLAECGEGRGKLTRLTLDGDQALLALDLDAWLRGEGPAPGTSESEPLILVCVHGKRDRCCARLGMPVYKALSALASERVLQTTHLGGHRFAATLLVLPQGVCYGRVEPAEAPALLAASRARRLHDLARIRGRTAYGPEAQAAEVVLRTRLSESREGALQLIDVTPRDATTSAVRFTTRDDDTVHEVVLTREALPPASPSCGAPPKPGERLVALRTTAPASG
jgi:hypothetical protein